MAKMYINIIIKELAINYTSRPNIYIIKIAYPIPTIEKQGYQLTNKTIFKKLLYK